MPVPHTASPTIVEEPARRPVPSSASLLESMRQLAAARASVRITLDEGEDEVGRVVLVDSRVMWAACRNQRRNISTFLVQTGGITREQLQLALANDQVKKGQKALMALLEETSLIQRPVLRRCLCLHVRAALRALFAYGGGRITARPFSIRADESLLLPLEEVLPASVRWGGASSAPREWGTASENPRATPAAPRTELHGQARTSMAPASGEAALARLPLERAAIPPRRGEIGAAESGAGRKELELGDLLGQLTAVEGVLSAVVVGRDGFVVDPSSRGSIHADVIGAVIAAGMGSAEVMGSQLEVGAMTQTMFEYESGVILMSVAGDAILAVVTDAQANLGMVRHQFRKRCPEIARALWAGYRSDPTDDRPTGASPASSTPRVEPSMASATSSSSLPVASRALS